MKKAHEFLQMQGMVRAFLDRNPGVKADLERQAKAERDRLLEAIGNLKVTSKNEPILRQCSICDEWLDEASQIASEYRDEIEMQISHGYCESCVEDDVHMKDTLIPTGNE